MPQDTTPTTLGLATVIFQVPDLSAAKAFYTRAFGQAPYFDQPFYVGYDIAGYELGLHPASTDGQPGPGGSTAYWRVREIEAAMAHVIDAGATPITAPQDVGDGIKVASVADPFGNVIGLIENPHFGVKG